MDKKPVYKGKEYYYTDSHMQQKLNQLRNQESSRENYEYTRNEPRNQEQIVLNRENYKAPQNPTPSNPKFYGI